MIYQTQYFLCVFVVSLNGFIGLIAKTWCKTNSATPVPTISSNTKKGLQRYTIFYNISQINRSRIYGWLCPIGQDLVYFFFIHYLHGILWIALTGNLFREEDGIF